MHRCNGEIELGSKALDDVLYRSQLELFPEPLLVSETLFLSPFFVFCTNITGSYYAVLHCVGQSVFCSGAKTRVIPLDYLHAFSAAALRCNP